MYVLTCLDNYGRFSVGDTLTVRELKVVEGREDIYLQGVTEEGKHYSFPDRYFSYIDSSKYVDKTYSISPTLGESIGQESIPYGVSLLSLKLANLVSNLEFPDYRDPSKRRKPYGEAFKVLVERIENCEYNGKLTKGVNSYNVTVFYRIEADIPDVNLKRGQIFEVLYGVSLSGDKATIWAD